MAERKTDQGQSPGEATSREQAVVAAYQAGKKITQIEAEFGVGRSTLYHILRRSGVMPARSRKQLDAATRDSALAGLHELIMHQDRLLAERDATIAERDGRIAALERQLGNGAVKPRRARRATAS